jgi:hypothetical protein
VIAPFLVLQARWASRSAPPFPFADFTDFAAVK